jgi:hypothetical protein
VKAPNRRRTVGLAIVIALLMASGAQADVGLIVSAANLQNETGALAPTGSIVILVVDTGGDGFTTALVPTSPLSPGSTLVGFDKPTNDVVIARWDLSSLNISGQSLNMTNVSLGALLATNRPLALYWFPSLTPASTNVGLTAFGFYTDSVGVDGSDPWIIPVDGSVVQLNFYTASRGGSNSNSAGLASFGIPMSRFRMTGISLSDTNVAVDFITVSNYVYYIQTTTDLVSGPWSIITSNLIGTGGIMTNIDVGAVVGPQRFYRLGLQF